MILPRRDFLAGIGALIAAPAIVRPELIMQIKPVIERTHRWLAAYYVGWDDVMLRADCLVGANGVISAPPVPQRGVYPVPEYLQRRLDKQLASTALRCLYSAVSQAENNTQHYVLLEVPLNLRAELRLS